MEQSILNEVEELKLGGLNMIENIGIVEFLPF